MSRSAVFPVEKVVRGNTNKPKNADFTGRYHRDQPIFVEKLPIIEHKPIRDAAGEPVRKHWNNGRSRIETEPVVTRYEEREFVIEDLGNGQTPRNYHFAPTEEELERQAAVAATQPDQVARFIERTNRIFDKLGLSEEDLEELAGNGEAEGDDAPAKTAESRSDAKKK